MFEPQNPKESEAKRIGRESYDAFVYLRPRQWIPTELTGVNDYGIDLFVQCKPINSIVDCFLIQHKGSEKPLPTSEGDISVPLKVSTLNYFLKIPSAVLLVYTNISDPDKPQSFYLFIQHYLWERYNADEFLKNPNKELVIKIPQSNRISKGLDISKELEAYRREVQQARAKYWGRMADRQCLADVAVERSTGFIDMREVNGNTYIGSTENVRLDAYLPVFPDYRLSCLLTFSKPELKSAMLSFGQESALKELLKCMGASYDDMARPYVVGRMDERIVLQLGNCRVAVSEAEASDIAMLLDDLARTYCDQMLLIENTLVSGSFEPSAEHRFGFRLCKVELWVWNTIHKFADAHRRDEGSSSWHIFGTNTYSLVIDFPADIGGHLVISPEWLRKDESRHDLYLVWNSVGYNQGFGDVVLDDLVDVQKAFNWVVNSLIPTAVYHVHQPKKKHLLRQRLISYELFLEDWRQKCHVKNERGFDFAEVQLPTIKYLEQLINELQSFYHALHVSVYINLDLRVEIYQGLLYLLDMFPVININSIAGNIGCSDRTGKLALMEHLNKQLQEFDKGTTNTFSLDLILRCYQILIRDNKVKLNELEGIKIIEKLRPLIEITSRYQVLIRWQR